MAIFNAAYEIQLHRAKFPFGRDIFVRNVNGNDATADGSFDFAYRNLSAAFVDVRSGFGDRVIWIKEGSIKEVAGYRDVANVTVAGKNDWALFGIGKPWLAGVTGVKTTPTISGWTRVSANLMNVTVTGHGVPNGAKVLITNVNGLGSQASEDGASLINGFWTVQSIPDVNTIQLTPVTGASAPARHTEIGAAGAEPFLSGGSAYLWHVPLSLNNCNNVQISGIGFTSASVSDWGGILINDCSRIKIVDCSFVSACCGWVYNGTGGEALIAGGLEPKGIQLLMESCFVGASHIGFGDLDNSVGPQPRILIDGNGDLEIRGCSFTDSPAFGVLMAKPIWYGGHAPREGVLITANKIRTEILSRGPDAGTEADPLGLLYNLHEQHPNKAVLDQGARIRIENNYYSQPADDGTQVVFISQDYPTKVDREGTPFPNADSIPQRADTVFGRDIQVIADTPETYGELAALAFYVGQGQVHYTEGATTPPIADLRLGLHGTSTSPIGTEEALQSLLASTGFTQVHVEGALTLTDAFGDYDGIGFSGVDPERDSVTIDKVNTPSTINAGFQFLRLNGRFGGDVSCQSCLIGTAGQTTEAVRGLFDRCSFNGVIEVGEFAGDKLRAMSISSDELISASFDMGASPSPTQLLVASSFGLFEVRNATDANDVVGWTGAGSQLTIAASCTNGIWQLGGYGEVELASASLPSTATQWTDDLLRTKSGQLAADGSATGTPTTTVVPTTITGYGDDFFNNMQAVFFDSNKRGSVRNVKDYDSATGTMTVDALPFTPVSGGLVHVLRVGSSGDPATIQAGLDAQGYTSARAVNLDNLDTALSTMLTELACLGLKNTVIDNQTYSGLNLTGARIRCFASAGAASAATKGAADDADSEIQRYTVTAAYVSGQLVDFRKVRDL